MKRSKLAFECPTSINNFEFANQFQCFFKKNIHFTKNETMVKQGITPRALCCSNEKYYTKLFKQEVCVVYCCGAFCS